MNEESKNRFQRYVNTISFSNDEYYTKNPRTLEELDEDLPKELSLSEFEGRLYITIGDEKPWLGIYNPKEDFFVYFEPELALYWLNEIKKYYENEATHS